MAGAIITLDAGWRLDAGHRFDQPPVIPMAGVAAQPKKKGTKHMDFMPNKRADGDQ